MLTAPCAEISWTGKATDSAPLRPITPWRSHEGHAPPHGPCAGSDHSLPRGQCACSAASAPSATAAPSWVLVQWRCWVLLTRLPELPWAAPGRRGPHFARGGHGDERPA